MLSRSSGKRWRCAAPTGMRDALARAAVGTNASAKNHAAGGELRAEECPWFRSDDSARQEFSSLFTEIFSAASRSEEHTSELQSLMRISYAVFCLKKKKPNRYH